MQNLAQQNQPSQPVLEYGRVLVEEEGSFSVRTAFGSLRAEKALSCLVNPRPGDTVLLSVDEAGGCFILSVLKREVGRKVPTDLVFTGPVRLDVKEGGLSITADQDLALASMNDLALASGNELALASEKVSLHANQGRAVVEELSFAGRFLRSQINHVKVVAETVENIFRRLTERLEEAFRYVKDHEEVQSGSARYLVEDTLTMHSKNAVHMSEEIIKLNAGQVHLG